MLPQDVPQPSKIFPSSCWRAGRFYELRLEKICHKCQISIGRLVGLKVVYMQVFVDLVSVFTTQKHKYKIDA